MGTSQDANIAWRPSRTHAKGAALGRFETVEGVRESPQSGKPCTRLELPLPNSPTSDGLPLLIYGRSNATGALVIQFAKASGLTVVMTASSRNFDNVKSLGADGGFDYMADTNIEDIHTVAALGDQGFYLALRMHPEEFVAEINERATHKTTLAYTAIGEAFQFGPYTFRENPGDLAFARDFWILGEKLITEGKIRVHRPKINAHGTGLTAVLRGLEDVGGGL
ncbi:hypothetical protein EDB81DRAFT_755573 [Dactylonectria macrodidyma]|uniref:Uncharacterized protein n=1 Tax=Dactylonectria macrodidyma TaxID=307937 RepID=A0A9P9FDQ2_9HYPO|nr:hypothetical protein EDB81DRAFT_755573 [Dactylonectria macrodidyma]